MASEVAIELIVLDHVDLSRYIESPRYVVQVSTDAVQARSVHRGEKIYMQRARLLSGSAFKGAVCGSRQHCTRDALHEEGTRTQPVTWEHRSFLISA